MNPRLRRIREILQCGQDVLGRTISTPEAYDTLLAEKLISPCPVSITSSTMAALEAYISGNVGHFAYCLESAANYGVAAKVEGYEENGRKRRVWIEATCQSWLPYLK